MAPHTPTRTRLGSDTLHRLLDEELDFSASFHVIYSNHLAMALVALEQLGAPPERLQAAFDDHAGSSGVERREDWALLRERLEEVHAEGIAATVRRRVPDLADTVGTALFHPIIRLAYGLDVRHEGQVAAALLDWELRADRSVPPASGRAGDRRLVDAATDLATAAGGSWHRTFDLAGVARRPEVAAALDRLIVDDATLDDVSAFALAAHATADDFLTLHLVTGSRAVQAVARVVDEATARRLAASAASAMTVGYAAIGAPAIDLDQLDGVRRSAIPSTDDIAARAITARDPHVIKLANVALVEAARIGDPLYRSIAARVVGLAGTGRTHAPENGV